MSLCEPQYSRLFPKEYWEAGERFKIDIAREGVSMEQQGDFIFQQNTLSY